MGAETLIENLREERSHSLGKMLQGPVRDNVWDRSIADIETPDYSKTTVGLVG
jgi:hypothetical protein